MKNCPFRGGKDIRSLIRQVIKDPAVKRITRETQDKKEEKKQNG
jgi:hypothetical protein